jgi:streptogramin lyase
LNIARNPGRNVANLIADIPAIGAPFAPYLSSANELTLAATYTGSGISSPTGTAIDAGGNVWITNAVGNSVTVVSHSLATANNYTAGAMNAPSGIAIDTSGNAWIANAGNSTLTELSSSGANMAGSPFTGGGLSTPTAIAIDGVGDIWLSNSTPIGSNYPISEFSPTGQSLSGSTGYIVSGVLAPVGIAINTK